MRAIRASDHPIRNGIIGGGVYEGSWCKLFHACYSLTPLSGGGPGSANDAGRTGGSGASTDRTRGPGHIQGGNEPGAGAGSGAGRQGERGGRPGQGGLSTPAGRKIAGDCELRSGGDIRPHGGGQERGRRTESRADGDAGTLRRADVRRREFSLRETRGYRLLAQRGTEIPGHDAAGGSRGAVHVVGPV